MCVVAWEHFCERERKQVREMAPSSCYAATQNHRQQILDNSSYSLFHRPWIPKGVKRERKMQTTSQPPQQALFTLSHNLLALTYYPTSLGPTLVFDSERFARLPSHAPHPPPHPHFPHNPNSFIFPSDKDLEDLTSGLTGDISKQLLKWKQAMWDEGKGPGLHNLSISALGYK